jgi:hypothetical protein
LKPGSSMRSTIAARFSGVTLMSLTLPTFTPATFTSIPLTAKEAFMKIARTR